MRFPLALVGVLWCLGAAVTYKAPEDCDWRVTEDNKISLICHLTAINSNVERTDFSVIPSERTAKLTVKCGSSEEDPNSLSRLEPSGFAVLEDLEELILDGCRLEEIPSHAFQGLKSLRRLVIISGTSLRVDPESFEGIEALEDLDLSRNSIRTLSLCQLKELRKVNLSCNEIGSFKDLGSSCQLPNLEVLDLSFNEITTLSDIQSSSTLTHLSVNNNFIRYIDVDLRGNSSLEVLDLSNNQISVLPSGLFRGLRRLRSLSLANNSLSVLNEDLFDGLSNLEDLDLSGNLLQSLNPRLTRELYSLSEFVLSGNRLTNIGSFDSLRNLTVLRLNNNEIDVLSQNLFEPLTMLKELDLSGNKISRLEPFSFNGLKQLTLLRLSGNEVESVHDAAFQNCTQLLVLDLSRNWLKTAPDSLKHLTVLQTLDLSYNDIQSIVHAPFLKMKQLWRLQLNANAIDNITVGLFNQLESLQILDLSSNNVEYIEKGAFDANRLLQAARLDHNKLKTINGIFQNLGKLIWLNVSDNEILHFDYALVPRYLHWLDISHNQIEELSNYFDLTGENRLSFLDASYNKIHQLGPHSVPDSISTLILNDNRINQIVPYTFFKKSKLSKVDLSVNELDIIDHNALRLSSEVTSLPEFFLGGNPIKCNCHMVWFKSINSVNSLHNYPHIKDIESIYCRLVHSKDNAFVPLVEARNEQFLCSYTTHCFALCQCCDFDACDCKMTCPTNCTCYHDNSWSKNIAECSNSGFHDLPDQLPMDASEIFLDDNVLPHLNSHTFIGRKNLKILHLNNSQIQIISNKTFNGLKSLSVLHLENNRLRFLKGFEFDTLSNLKELYLQYNLLQHIHNLTFKNLRRLEVLHLYGNRLVDFPVWQLVFNPFLGSIKLADNFWSCDCEYMERFRSWMTVYNSKIYDAEVISCVSNEANQDDDVFISHFDITTCSSNAVATTRVQEQHQNEYLPLLAAVLASFACLLLILLCVYIFRNNLRLWIHSKYGVRVFSEDDIAGAPMPADATETEKLFDVFVTYSRKDDTFVRQILVPELEKDYKMCLYHRDLPTCHISDNILQATEASKRSVIVLSESFLKFEWSHYEYKSSLHQAFRCGRKKKLIIILLQSVSGRDLDPDLRLYLKTNVVLQWGDRRFWEKLRFALLDIVFPQKCDQLIKHFPNLPGQQVPTMTSLKSVAVHI